MNKIILSLLLTFTYNYACFAQVKVVNKKGTVITIDSTNWSNSATNIYNKNIGNVGIGSTNPTYKLDITGKVRITDSLVANSSRIISLNSGSINDSLVVSDPSTGILKRISANRISGSGSSKDSTTASNGLTLTGKDVRLGGALSAATTITTSATNTLALAGLQSGTLNDSFIVADASSGLLKRISSANLAGWTLRGNSGTTPGTDFIGTKDNVDLVFKINNVESGRLNLFNLSASFGYNSVAAYKSTAMGYEATTTTNTESVAVGYKATSTHQSVAIGSDATTSNGSAIAIGQSSTAGYQASAIGANTSATGNNSTALGFGATTSQANALVLGNSSVKVGIGTSTPAYRLDVKGAINADSTVSAPNFTATVQTITGTWNMNLGANASWTLSAGTNTLSITNVKPGMFGLIKLINSGTSNITLPSGSKVINGGGGTVALTKTASAVDILTFYYDGSNYWWTFGNNYN